MKKSLKLATVFCIVLFTMIGCSNTDKEVIFESEEPALMELGEEHAKETTYYALYPSFLQEQTTDETNQYVYYKKEFSLYFP